jgi:hypothetical protein
MPKVSIHQLSAPAKCRPLVEEFLKNLQSFTHENAENLTFYDAGVFALGLTLRGQTPETLESISAVDLRDFVVNTMHFVCSASHEVDDNEPANPATRGTDKKDLN